MTEQEKHDISERAEIEGRILANVVIPRLRGEIWKASATTSLIAGFLLFTWYRSDFAALKAELRSTHPVAIQAQHQTITVDQVDGLVERETRRLLQERKVNGDMRRIGGANFSVASGFDR